MSRTSRRVATKRPPRLPRAAGAGCSSPSPRSLAAGRPGPGSAERRGRPRGGGRAPPARRRGGPGRTAIARVLRAREPDASPRRRSTGSARPCSATAPSTASTPSSSTAVLLVESGARPWAVSPMGARGLMQVMPHMLRPDGHGREPLDDRDQHRGRLHHPRGQHPPPRRGGRHLGLLLGLRDPRRRLPRARAGRARPPARSPRPRKPPSYCRHAAIPQAMPARSAGSRRTSAAPERAGRAPLLFRRAWLPRRPSARARSSCTATPSTAGATRSSAAGSPRAASRCTPTTSAATAAPRGRAATSTASTSYLDDLDRVLEAVRDEHPELPIALLGHSMGGLVVAAFLADRRPPVAAAATSGAALAIGPGVSRGALRRGAPAAPARAAPRPRQRPRSAGPLAGSGGGAPLPRGSARLPHHDAVARRRAADGDSARRARARSRSRCRCCCSTAATTRSVPIEGSRAFHGGLRVPGSAFRAYPGLRHEIFNEPEREQVFARPARVAARDAARAERAERRAAGSAP